MAELIRGSLVVALSGSAGGFGFNALAPTTEAGGFGWGRSMDVTPDAQILVVGDVNNAEVHTWDYSGGAWVERAGSPMDTGRFNNFGHGVAISDDGLVLAVGEPTWANGGSARGAVHIYDYNGGTGAWDVRGRIDGTVNSDYFGWSVDLSPDGSRIHIGTRTGAAARIIAYDWGGASWAEDVPARLPRPGTVGAIVPSDYWARNFNVTTDGTHLVGTYYGYGAGDLGSAVGIWTWNGSAWSRKGGEIVSPLGDNDEEQAVAVAISDDGLTVYVAFYGLYYTWTGRMEVFDWVDPNWVSNATKTAALVIDPIVDYNTDYGQDMDMWVNADESVVASVLYRGSGSDVYFWGDVPGATTPCITKTQDTSRVVVVDTYCAEEIPPSNWEADPVNVPRPPWGQTAENEQVNTNCTDKGFYRVYSDVGPAVNANAEYEQWLAENFWNVDFNDGVCN